jgi:DNA-binding transcriptional MerR regulator
MIALFIAAAAAAGQPGAAPPPAAPPSQADQIAAFQQSLKQRGFSDAGIRTIVAAAPQGAAQAQTLQGQAEAAVAELRTAAAASPIDVARVSALLRRLDDISAQLSRLGTDATVRNLTNLSEPDRRLLLETMGLRGNPQAPSAAPAPQR